MKSTNLLIWTVLLLASSIQAQQNIPQLSHIYHYWDRPVDIAIYGNHAMISTDEYLDIYDISNPAHPELLGYAGVGGVAINMLTDSLVWVVCRSAYALDISNPAEIETLTRLSSRGRDYFSFHTDGQLAVLVSCWSSDDPRWPYVESYFDIYDVTNLRQPVQLHHNVYDERRLYWTVLYGDYLYYYEWFWGGVLQVMDISNPRSPEPLVTTDLNCKPVGITNDGRTLYVIEYDSGHFAIVDVSDPGEPVLITELDDYSTPRDIEVKDTILNLVFDDGSLLVINAANPESPEVVTELQTEDPGLKVSIDQGFAGVIDSNYVVEFYDLNEPDDPEFISFFDNHGQLTALGVGNDYAYVAEAGSGLKIVDISTPEIPVEVGTWASSLPILDIAVSVDVMYLTAGDSGLVIVDISDPDRVETIHRYIPGQSVLKVDVVDNYAYILIRNQGVQIINITDPNEPEILALIADVGYFQVVDNFLYGCRNSNDVDEIREYDISNKSNPQLIRSFPIPETFDPFYRNINAALIEGRLLYCVYYWGWLMQPDVGDMGSNLLILDISAPDTTIVMADLVIDNHYEPYWSTNLLAVKNRQVFIYEGGNQIALYSCWDPSHPIRQWYLEDSRHTSAMAFYDDYVLVSTPSSLFLYDCSAALSAPLSHRPSLPSSFILHPAYPNPFNSSTTITYSLPTQSPVTLQIYNTRGQLVDVLLDRVMPAGRHSVVWEADGMSTGVYLVRMKDEGGRMKKIQKIVLVK